MIFRIYALFNKKIGAYNTPIYNTLVEADFVETTIRAVKAGQIEHPEELDLYFLGIFNDKTGESKTANPIFLLSLGGVEDASETD